MRSGAVATIATARATTQTNDVTPEKVKALSIRASGRAAIIADQLAARDLFLMAEALTRIACDLAADALCDATAAHLATL